MASLTPLRNFAFGEWAVCLNKTAFFAVFVFHMSWLDSGNAFRPLKALLITTLCGIIVAQAVVIATDIMIISPRWNSEAAHVPFAWLHRLPTSFDIGLIKQVIKQLWRHQMETCSAFLALFEGNSPVTGEFSTQRWVTRSFDIFFDLRPNKRLSKPSRRRRFETPSRSSWRHCNVTYIFHAIWRQGTWST